MWSVAEKSERARVRGGRVFFFFFFFSAQSVLQKTNPPPKKGSARSCLRGALSFSDGGVLEASSRSLLAMHVSSQFEFNLPAREMLFACLSLIIDAVLRSPVCAETETWCCNDKRLSFNFTVCHHCLSAAILLIPAADCH